ncbi:hypothetical protein PARC_a0556 [Pseudoalteromonas arctica A 37-1-2]|uniref:Uncharacterized protein n=1 Tax=Pseudoalteromonas arctica A 37-1-2 TaxID=1117313 RepID=A0A290S166_9GAMM|nr:hypothetical protein PARC_a0556 [Pseudoalteromonas arctica A 37-1-2]
MSLVTTLPIAITTPSPILIPGHIFTPKPSQQALPIVTFFLMISSS